MDLVPALTLKTMKYNFYFKAVHLPGHSNDIADSISRFQQTRFRRLAPHADQQPQPLSEEEFFFQKNFFNSSTHLSRSDVSFHDKTNDHEAFLNLRIKASKTDPFRSSTTITIAALLV